MLRLSHRSLRMGFFNAPFPLLFYWINLPKPRFKRGSKASLQGMVVECLCSVSPSVQGLWKGPLEGVLALRAVLQNLEGFEMNGLTAIFTRTPVAS